MKTILAFLVLASAAHAQFTNPKRLDSKPPCSATVTTSCITNADSAGLVALPAVQLGTPSSCYLAANIGATNSATPANVCAGWPVVAGGSYALHCQVSITFVASATVAFTLAGPGSPARWAMRFNGLTGAAAAFQAFNGTGTTTYTALTSGAPGAVTSTVILDAAITNGATASGTNLTLTTKANGTNNINVLSDSYCILTRLN